MPETAFDFEALIGRLERFPAVLQAATVRLDEADARWQPPPVPNAAGQAQPAWSIVEIVAHLADEEEADFSVRLQLTLDDPAKPWPSIDPEGWAVCRAYRERSLTGELSRFGIKRAKNLVWLCDLNDQTPWDRTHHHPQFGPFRAGDMLAAWCAHDWLHLRQIAKRQYQLTARDAGDYSTRYAGEW